MVDTQVVLDSIARLGSKRNIDGMARYGIVAPKVFGVSVANLHKLAKRYGRDHELALALWDTGWYEARMLAAFVDEPAKVTAAQMNTWARDFDNWAICDTVCMHLFDRTPHAWKKVAQWHKRREEFVKRAAFALLASLALHDKHAADSEFIASLRLIESAAADERNFVKKGVNWALRSIGMRNEKLYTAAVRLSEKLASSDDPTTRWIGKDALRDLLRPVAKKRVASKTRKLKSG